LPLSSRTLLIALAGAVVARSVSAQTDARAFPAASFDSIARTADWLMQYDRVARETSALVTAAVPHLPPAQVARIGAEWFCFERDSAWHAVYGRYDASRRRYDVVLHYVGRPGSGFVVGTVAPDTSLTARYGRAFQVTRARIPADVRDEGVQLTTFIRPRPDGGIDVWYLPAFQPDGWAVHGIELRYGLDAAARQVTDSTIIVGTLRGSLLDSTVAIDIDNRRNTAPTVGQSFFAMQYASSFHAIAIHNRDFVSRYAPIGDKRAWVHDRLQPLPPEFRRDGDTTSPNSPFSRAPVSRRRPAPRSGSAIASPRIPPAAFRAVRTDGSRYAMQMRRRPAIE
jgi:hypothetical protein